MFRKNMFLLALVGFSTAVLAAAPTSKLEDKKFSEFVTDHKKQDVTHQQFVQNRFWRADESNRLFLMTQVGAQIEVGIGFGGGGISATPNYEAIMGYSFTDQLKMGLSYQFQEGYNGSVTDSRYNPETKQLSYESFRRHEFNQIVAFNFIATTKRLPLSPRAYWGLMGRLGLGAHWEEHKERVLYRDPNYPSSPTKRDNKYPKSLVGIADCGINLGLGPFSALVGLKANIFDYRATDFVPYAGLKVVF